LVVVPLESMCRHTVVALMIFCHNFCDVRAETIYGGALSM